ncbi:hypothetical protein EG240_05425 [Paenimyroides tangerinum]|uniref:Uncharacterized protein n=1 Tax=Paenimyroides tangerinum TaxID=2488728 RepID=A0A3P3W917_9FLAO|nr:hypothetical protein [Paenimyroides tangerinum]RRJ91641.1 hypothetical protein EG240_05425 [Paenimyroides tangerinum]
MKKLMFSALACVAFAFSGFASNEVVNENLEIKNGENTTTIEKYVFSEEDGCTICNLITLKFDDYGDLKSSSTQRVRVCNNTCDEINKKLKDMQDERDSKDATPENNDYMIAY